MSFRASPRKLHKYFVFILIILLAACGGQQTEEPTTDEGDIPIETDLIYIPAGPFWMGSSEEDDPLARPDEFPLHRVLLDGYFIFRNEVTNAEYQQCVEAGQCTPPTIFEDGPSTHYNDPAYALYPVVGVDWFQAGAFCNWIDARLPTEAEWEKTARGEFAGLYPWGDDEPTCSLSNMAGCFVDPPDTDKIGQYPNGESIFEANDMAGNVWEWTSDWYLEDYYAMSANVAPLGPDEGELKVVRGGGYDSDAVDLRAAARMALDPEEAFNNVGFRCIPVGEGTAAAPPICAPNYYPFCNDPYNPPGEDCDPPPTTQQGTGTPTGGYDLTGFGCPENGLVNITIQGDGSSADSVEVTVNGIVFTCVDSTVVPGRWVCTGSPPPMGTYATISVCPQQGVSLDTQLLSVVPNVPNAPSQGLVNFQPAAADELIAYVPPQQNQNTLIAFQQANPVERPQLQAVNQSTTGGLCPDGYSFNETTGQCETDPGQDGCPDGWTRSAASNQCVPDGEDGCPEGTSFVADQGCTPDEGGECPDGYTYAAATNTCEPPGNDGGSNGCPEGYFYNSAISCCSPQDAGNFDCDPGFYRNVATNQCEPLDEDGCPEGQSYNRYEGGCVPDTGDGGDNGQTGEDGCRTPGYVMNDAGQCVPGEGSTQRVISVCDEGQYFDPVTLQCVTLGDGECPPGYYYDANRQACRPTDGPDSGCAPGYAFHPRLNCCVPTPGNDGSYCPGEEQTANGLVGVAAPTDTSYDYGQGFCDPGEDGCPYGFVYDPQTESCVPVDTNPTPPDESGGCTEGYVYDEAYGGCVPELVLQPVSAAKLTSLQLQSLTNQCGEGQYFDYDLGYCVPADCNGCALGFYYEPRLDSCVPYPDGDSCPNGYYYDTDLQTCLPLGNDGQTTEQGCWTITQSVPVCEFATPTTDPRCPNPNTHWDETRDRCVSDTDEDAGPECQSYGTQNSCVAAGCTWVFSTTSYCRP